MRVRREDQTIPPERRIAEGTNMMKRTILASVLATAVALGGITASASQARAGDDYAKIIIGATALAIVGAAIASSHHGGHKYKYKPYPTRHHNAHKPYAYRYKPYAHHSRNHGYRPGYGRHVQYSYERHVYRGGRPHGGHGSYSYR